MGSRGRCRPSNSARAPPDSQPSSRPSCGPPRASASDRCPHLPGGRRPLRLLALSGAAPVRPVGQEVPITRELVSGCAVLDRRTIHVATCGRPPPGGAIRDSRLLHLRTMLAAPLLREDAAVGLIIIRRSARPAFTAKQIALLRTFADQAAIALENERLFTRAGGAEPRSDRVAGAADGDGRDPAGHLQVADRRAAGPRRDRGERDPALRRGVRIDVPFDGHVVRSRCSRTAVAGEREAVGASSRPPPPGRRPAGPSSRPGHSRPRRAG